MVLNLKAVEKGGRGKRRKKGDLCLERGDSSLETRKQFWVTERISGP